jgi:hypothetical protein
VRLVDEKEEDGGAVTWKQRKQARSTTVGPAPPTGGPGLHGERRSHGRPPTPPPPLLLLPLFSFSGGSVDRGGFSPEAARVGRTRGAAALLLIGEARRGARGRWGCSGGSRRAVGGGACGPRLGQKGKAGRRVGCGPNGKRKVFPIFFNLIKHLIQI